MKGKENCKFERKRRTLPRGRDTPPQNRPPAHTHRGAGRVQRRNRWPLGSAAAITTKRVSKSRKAPNSRRESSQDTTSGIHKGATLMRILSPISFARKKWGSRRVPSPRPPARNTPCRRLFLLHFHRQIPYEKPWGRRRAKGSFFLWKTPLKNDAIYRICIEFSTAFCYNCFIIWCIIRS